MRSGNPGERILERVKKTLSKYGMVRSGDIVVVAVSGGPDSVCLFHALHQLSEEMQLNLVAAHFEHGWRPGEDEQETELVRGLAESLGVPFETERAGATLRGGSLSREEAARNSRYAFLERVREKHRASSIAVGHHLHDQAETLLMRLLRGSGVSGLGAIPPVREGRIIRPLIEVTKPQIEMYIEETGLRCASDSSNLRTDFLRNRVRMELIPLLLNYQPRLIERLGETASLLREESEFMDSLATRWIERNGTRAPDGIRVDLSHFAALAPALRKRVVRGILKRVKGDIRRIGGSHIRSVEELARSERPQAGLNLPGGLNVRRSYESLSFHLGTESEPARFSYLLNEPGTVFIREIGKALTLALCGEGEWMVPATPWTATLDAEKARFPLVVRSFAPGDRFVPLGMKGHKKLKDFFVDRKVPSSVRRATPILVMGQELLWVAGYRIDERFKVTPSTRVVLEARLH
jgi:tRNA(Ile)-lysidine synthase